jgi:hypothetical protein
MKNENLEDLWCNYSGMPSPLSYEQEKNENKVMTKEEMDQYLESIGGLENGIFTDRPPITNASFMDIQPGWYPLIKELIDDLIALGWNKQITQIKEKYGTLRFYIGGGSDAIWDRIEKAEADSEYICEITGKTGKLRDDLGWWKTLCDEEYEKLIK